MVIMHILMWIAVFLFPLLFFHRPGQQSPGVSDFFLWSLMIVYFYTNYYVLVPKLLTRNRFLLYSITLLLLLLIAFFSLRQMLLVYDSQVEMENLLRRHTPEQAQDILKHIAINRGMGGQHQYKSYR
jgi:hypothetical protein